jgi:hypothetical protein
VIRKAELEDVPYIANDTALRLHARLGSTKEAEIHKPTMFRVMEHFVRANDKLFIVSEHEEIIRGFLMASIEPFWWADPMRGRRYVTDWAFYSEIRGDGVLMLKAMQEWAWMQPRVIEVAVATNVPKGRGVVEAMFNKAGMEQVGGRFKVSKPE